jgi:alpha-tubulin suppressor-like RCC1 family protein
MNTRQAFGWGSNANGQLGLPEKKVHVRPQVIPLPGSASDFEPTAVSCGSHHSILLNEGCESFLFRLLSVELS